MSPTTRADTAQRPSWRRNVGGAGGGRARSYRRGPDKKAPVPGRAMKKGLASTGRFALQTPQLFDSAMGTSRPEAFRSVFLEVPMKGSRRGLVYALILLLASVTTALAQTYHGGVRGAVREAGG